MVNKTGKQTKNRLALTPFASAAELKAAKERIKLEVWSEVERAKQRRDLLELEEYRYVKETFEHGWITDANGNSEEIIKIQSASDGTIRISLSRDFSENNERAQLACALVQGLSASYAPIYYQAIGVLPCKGQKIEDLSSKEV